MAHTECVCSSSHREDGAVYPTHIPVSPPAHLVPEAPTTGTDPQPCSEAPVHGTSSLSTEWNLHQGMCRAGRAQRSGTLWQVAPGQTDTDPPDSGVTKAAALPHPSRPAPPHSGDYPCLCTLWGGGQGAAAQGGPTTVPIPVSVRAGSRSRPGSKAALVVLLCGCQAMVSSNSKQREQRG